MPEPDLAQLVKEVGLCRQRATSIASGGSSITKDLEIDPYEFLAQAEGDFNLGGESAYPNAITNAKRPIVSQMDQTLLSFGYPATHSGLSP